MPGEPSTLAELEAAPLSAEILAYYRERVAASEAEMAQLIERIDAVAETHATQHKARWEVHKRMDEVSDLQKALSDSHVYLWEEKERSQRLQAEVDELKLQEVEDRRKIQHLLSLVGPVVQDVTYVRDAPPETITLQPHGRATTSSSSAATHRETAPSGARRAAGVPARAPTGGRAPMPTGGAPSAPPASARLAGLSNGLSAPSSTADGARSGDGTRVLRTVYLPNEQVDSMLLTIEALRAQLQQQERLSRERISALLEDRRLRMAEERARRVAESERLQEVEQNYERAQGMLSKYTKDFLELKHSTLQQLRLQKEEVVAVREENASLSKTLAELREETAMEVHSVTYAAKRSSEQYVSLYRQQVSDTERTMGLLKDQHNGLQQALALRVKELEGVVQRLKHQYRQLDDRRALELEGFNSEVALLVKQVQRLELRAFGRHATQVELPLTASGSASTMASRGAKAVRAMKVRLTALENSLMAEEVA